MMSKTWIVFFLLWQFSIVISEKARQKSGGNFVNSLKARTTRLSKSAKLGEISESLEDAVGIFEPSFLAQVWPKLRNGMHLSLSEGCWRDFGLFMRDVPQGRAWALRVVDSTGRYEPGLLGGNRYWLGSKRQCMDMDRRFRESSDNSTLEELRNGDYVRALQRQHHLYGSREAWRALLRQDALLRRVVAADNTPPCRLAVSAVLAHLNLTRATLHLSQQVLMGVCLPMSCTAADVHELFEFSIAIGEHLKFNKSAHRSARVIRVRQLDPNYSVVSDYRTAILLLFLTLLILLIIFATMIDLNLVQCLSGSRSFDLEQPAWQSVMATSAIESETIDNVPSDRVNRNLQICSKPKLSTADISVVLPREFPENFVDIESARKNNLNPVTVKKGLRVNNTALNAVVDVTSSSEGSSCKRCGRYRKQCQDPKATDRSTTLPACHKLRANSYEVLTIEKKEHVKIDWNALLRSLLLSFSLTVSARKIFNTTRRPHSLDPVHGVRVLSVFWIIYIHVELVSSYLSDDSGEIENDTDIYRTLARGTYAFDTLFFVSGLLSCHHFLCLKSRYSTKELVGVGGAPGQVLQFVCFITNRAVRLLPAYMVVIFSSAAVSRWLRARTLLQLPERDSLTCDKFWWRNVLYINTFYPARERCVQWSWYLSADAQLHAAGVLLLTCLAGRARVAAAVAAALLVVGAGTDAVLGYTQRLATNTDGAFSVYERLLTRGWSRLAPYLLGLCTGWLLHRTRYTLALSRVQAGALWALSLSVLALLGSDVLGARLGEYGALVYSCVSHVAWSLALAWLTCACVTGHAGRASRVLAHASMLSLSRLSYSALLAHPLIIRVALLAPDASIHQHLVSTVVRCAGAGAACAAGALWLAVCVEAPFSSLLRRALHCHAAHAAPA